MNNRQILRFSCIVVLMAFGCGASAQMTSQETTTTATTTLEGTVSELVPSSSTIVVRTAEAEPTRYVYSKKTVFVDEAGNPASIEVVKSGAPVTVYYVKEGDSMLASKVVVKKAPASVIEKHETTTTTTEEK